MDSSVKYGLGVTTPNEMATVFALLAQPHVTTARMGEAIVKRWGPPPAPRTTP